METKYHRWTVINPEKIIRENRVYWLCQCECGTHREISIKNLKSGQSKSCGCLRQEILLARNTKHNLRFTKVWRAWQSMKMRCNNHNMIQYKDYGGRGIKVCDEWQKDFMAFYKYVGDAPVDKTLDRIDTDGNYEPGNVQWSTPKQQGQNKRDNRKINGICVSEISRSLGGGHNLVAKRLDRGWDVERAITEKTHALK